MNRSFRHITIIGIAFLSLSCIRETVAPEQRVTGQYALDDGSGMTHHYVEFKKGKLTVYQSSINYPLVENHIWNASQNAFEKKSEEKYTITERTLYCDGPVKGEIHKDGDILTIGDNTYVSLLGVKGSPYSIIKPEKQSYEIPYQKSDYSFPVEIDHPIKCGEVSVSSVASWITDLRWEDGTVRYSVSATQLPRSGTIVIQYTHAVEVRVEIKQIQQTFIRLENSSRTVDYMASSQVILYSVENPPKDVSLNVTTSASWISDIVVMDNEIQFNVSENNSGTSRSAQLILSFEGAVDVVFDLTQTWAAASIVLSPTSTEVFFSRGSASFSFEILNPREGTVIVAQGQDDWISDVTVSGHTVHFDYSENNTGDTRIGTIRLSYGNYSTIDFTVVQTWTASEILFAPAFAEMDYNGGNSYLTVEIRNPREGITVYATSQAEWITHVNVSETNVYFTVERNDTGASRTGVLLISYGSYANREFTVTQTWSPAEIVLTPANETVDYRGGAGSFAFEIQNPRQGTIVSAKSQSDWLTGISVSESKVNYTVKENNSAESRTGIIKLTYGDYAKKEFIVSQSGKPVMSLTLNKSTLSLSVGTSETLVATVDPADAPLQWSSTRPAVASVNQEGKVSAIENGTATICVKSNDGKSAECIVTVTTPVTGVRLNKTVLNLSPGESETLIATVIPSTASNRAVFWSSDNTNSVTVDKNGVVSAVADGTASITVHTEDGDKTATCVVTVKTNTAVTGISLNKTELSLNIGDFETLIATVIPATATNKSVTWSSNRTAVATVDQNGGVFAVTTGTAQIMATTMDGNKTASCSVTVVEGYVDLGLSVQWATCNLGASNPWEKGDYYAWGEIYPYYSSLNPLIWKAGKENGYSWESYSLCDGTKSSLTKYNTDSSLGKVDNKTRLELVDDAANARYGERWRMPTKDEWNELLTSSFCSWTWMTQNGVSGYRVLSSRTGKSIFLPGGGVFTNTELNDNDTNGNYWLSTLFVDDPSQADRAYVSTEGKGINTRVRRRGQSIRPVVEFKANTPSSVKVGDIVDDGGLGVVFWTSGDGKSYYLVSVSEIQRKVWQVSYDWCKSYGDGSWDMPTIDELTMLHAAYSTVNAVLRNSGYTLLSSSNCYWSQTVSPSGSNYRYRERLDTGNIYHTGSDENINSQMNYTRAIKCKH